MVNRSQDEKLIRELFEALCTAWNHADGESYGACFSEDADYVTFNGQHLKGRNAIAESHQELFQGVLKGSSLSGEIVNLRFLTPEVAVFQAVGAVKLRWQKKVPESRKSINTNVVVKQNGEWKIASFHNCRIQKPGILMKLFSRFKVNKTAG